MNTGQGSAITLRVLVVDDEPGMRLSVARALRDFSIAVPDIAETVHFVTDQAETGEQAIERIGATPPDILLLDHKLPGISGLEVLDHVYRAVEPARKNEMLTVMITAYASIETAVRATRQGAYDFLAKPFTPAELKNAVRKAAEHVIIAQQARKLAQEKRQVRFQFISVLAHELKAPLGAVEGYLQVLKDQGPRLAADDPATFDHAIDRCLTRMSFMQKMIADLLDLTRIESGQKKRELSEVDVAEVARAAIDTASPQAQERGIAVSLRSDGPAILTADRNEIEIMLNNLISNAVKYNRDRGTVDVTVNAEEGDVVIGVADTGIGLTEEESARLFQDFVRIKNEHTLNIYGSGLGLSIVKKLAQLYGGSVAVSSQPDVGSTFTVVLGKHSVVSS